MSSSDRIETGDRAREGLRRWLRELAPQFGRAIACASIVPAGEPDKPTWGFLVEFFGSSGPDDFPLEPPAGIEFIRVQGNGPKVRLLRPRPEVVIADNNPATAQLLHDLLVTRFRPLIADPENCKESALAEFREHTGCRRAILDSVAVEIAAVLRAERPDARLVAFSGNDARWHELNDLKARGVLDEVLHKRYHEPRLIVGAISRIREGRLDPAPV